MSGRNQGTQQASPQEKAFAEMAARRMADYRQRWLPAQQRLTQVMQNMGKPDSSERQELAGKAVADTGIKFDKAAQQVEASGADRGIGPGSAASKLALTGLSSDEAASKGIAKAGTDETVDNAYLSGLTQVMALGRGQAGHAISGMGQMAQLGERNAAIDAESSASDRAGWANLAGQGIGFGMKYGTGGSKPAGVGGTNLFAGDTSGNFSNVGGGGIDPNSLGIQTGP